MEPQYTMPLDGLQETKRLKLKYYRQKYTMPDVELQAIVKSTKYHDKTSTGLTSWICDYIKFIGGKASRVNTTGTYSKQLGRFIKSGSSKGASDIDVVYQGRAIKVEVKIGRDRQSDIQRQWQQEIEAAGGIYYIARTFQSFFEWFNSEIRKG